MQAAGVPSFRWQHSHRPYRVLDAPNLSGDYYSQPLRWGTDRVATLLGSQLLVFDPEAPRSFATFTSPTQLPNALTALCLVPDDRGATDGNLCAVGDRNGGVTLCRTVPNSQEIAADCILPGADSDAGDGVGGAELQPWEHPHVAGVTCLDAANSSTIAVGFGHGSVVIVDTRRPPARGPVSVCLGYGSAGAGSSRVTPDITSPSTPRNAGGVGGALDLDASLYRPATPDGAGGSTSSAHADAVCAVAFAPGDERRLASGGNDGLVRLWTLSMPGRPVAEYAHGAAAVRALTWHPRRAGVLATGGGIVDGTIVVRDTHLTGADAVVAGVATGSQVTQLQWTHDGAFLISAHGHAHQDTPFAPVPLAAGDTTTSSTPPSPSRSVGGTNATAQGMLPSVTATYGAAAAATVVAAGSSPLAVSLPQAPCRRNSLCVWSLDGAASRHGAFQGGPPMDRLRRGGKRSSGARTPLGVLLRENGANGNGTPAPSASDAAGSTGGGSNWGGHRARTATPPAMSDSDARSCGSASCSDVDADDAVAASPAVAGFVRIGSVHGHSTRPLHLAQQQRPTGRFVSGSGGRGDETLRFWQLFTCHPATPGTPVGSGAVADESGAVASGAAACGAGSRASYRVVDEASSPCVAGAAPSLGPDWDLR